MKPREEWFQTFTGVSDSMTESVHYRTIFIGISFLDMLQIPQDFPLFPPTDVQEYKYHSQNDKVNDMPLIRSRTLFFYLKNGKCLFLERNGIKFSK